MTGILSGLRVVELSAFVAAPLGGLVLAELGAEVIRVDPLGGGLDRDRWPITESGESLYWAGLNQGKKSVAIDMRSEEGRQIVRRLITAPGDGAGILITNVAPAWLDIADLQRQRRDLIAVILRGSSDGKIAVDYTVNAAMGIPLITGNDETPVNHVLPAWDVIAGHMIATAVLAADRHRLASGRGQQIDLALSDVAVATLSHLGMLAEVEVNDKDRQADGNYIYGTYGRDFETSDGIRLMVAALTPRQWRSLVAATETQAALEQLGEARGWDFERASDRYEAREEISLILEPWFADHTSAEVFKTLDSHRVCWDRYQTVRELLTFDRRASDQNPMLAYTEHPEIGSYLSATSPLNFGAIPRRPPQPSPRHGQDTYDILQALTGIEASELARLADLGVINRDI